MEEVTLNEIAEKLGSVIPVFFRKLTRPLEQGTKNLISPLQIHALEILSEREISTMTELSNELKISKQQMTPMIDKLIKSGFVLREHDSVDRRSVKISLTQSGLSFLNDFRKDIHATLKGQIESLDEDDLLCLNNALSDLFRIINKIP